MNALDVAVAIPKDQLPMSSTHTQIQGSNAKAASDAQDDFAAKDIANLSNQAAAAAVTAADDEYKTDMMFKKRQIYKLSSNKHVPAQSKSVQSHAPPFLQLQVQAQHLHPNQVSRRESQNPLLGVLNVVTPDKQTSPERSRYFLANASESVRRLHKSSNHTENGGKSPQQFSKRVVHLPPSDVNKLQVSVETQNVNKTQAKTAQEQQVITKRIRKMQVTDSRRLLPAYKAHSAILSAASGGSGSSNKQYKSSFQPLIEVQLAALKDALIVKKHEAQSPARESVDNLLIKNLQHYIPNGELEKELDHILQSYHTTAPVRLLEQRQSQSTIRGSGGSVSAVTPAFLLQKNCAVNERKSLAELSGMRLSSHELTKERKSPLRKNDLPSQYRRSLAAVGGAQGKAQNVAGLRGRREISRLLEGTAVLEKKASLEAGIHMLPSFADHLTPDQCYDKIRQLRERSQELLVSHNGQHSKQRINFNKPIAIRSPRSPLNGWTEPNSTNAAAPQIGTSTKNNQKGLQNGINRSPNSSPPPKRVHRRSQQQSSQAPAQQNAQKSLAVYLEQQLREFSSTQGQQQQQSKQHKLAGQNNQVGILQRRLQGEQRTLLVRNSQTTHVANNNSQAADSDSGINRLKSFGAVVLVNSNHQMTPSSQSRVQLSQDSRSINDLGQFQERLRRLQAQERAIQELNQQQERDRNLKFRQLRRYYGQKYERRANDSLYWVALNTQTEDQGAEDAQIQEQIFFDKDQQYPLPRRASAARSQSHYSASKSPIRQLKTEYSKWVTTSNKHNYSFLENDSNNNNNNNNGSALGRHCLTQENLRPWEDDKEEDNLPPRGFAQHFYSRI